MMERPSDETNKQADIPGRAAPAPQLPPEAATPVAPAPDMRARRRAVRRLLRAEIFYGMALIAFAVLASLAYSNAYFGWDVAVANRLQTLPIPGLFGLMRFVSVFGDRWIPYALATATGIVFFLCRRRSEAFGLLLSVGGSALLNSLLKALIARPRPSPELVAVFRPLRSQSFPSGHVTFYVCFFGFLFFVAFALLPRGSLARRLALTFAALPILLVGCSRVYLGEHWPSDTLGAYLWSGVWLAFSVEMYRRWKQRATFHADAPASGNQT